MQSCCVKEHIESLVQGPTVSIITQQQWISYSAELPIIRRFWHIAFKRRPDIEPVMVIPNLLLMRKAVVSGMVVSVLPHYIYHKSITENRLNILWEPNETMVNELWVTTRKVDRYKPEIERFIYLLTR
jgi:DNA-binding transcriptional LysR family regulator